MDFNLFTSNNLAFNSIICSSLIKQEKTKTKKKRKKKLPGQYELEQQNSAHTMKRQKAKHLTGHSSSCRADGSTKHGNLSRS